MYSYISYLSFLTSGIGVFFIFFLSIRFHQFPKTYWLISIIFAFVYIEFYTYALVSKHILNMLFLFRSANIIRAILPIHLFFYVRGMLFPNKRLKPIHYLNYLFPVIVTIGIMPDLLLSDAEKVQIFDNFYQNPDYLLKRPVGYFPSATLQPISMIIVCFYAIYTLLFIYFSQYKLGKNFTYINKNSIFWLKLLCIFVFIYFGSELVSYRTLQVEKIFDSYAKAITCILGLGLFAYFMLTPNVQENLDGCLMPKVVDEKHIFPTLDEISPVLKNEFRDNEIALHFEKQIKSSKCYLNASCDLQSVANIVEISPQKLSNQIKSYFGISFAEYINRLKIHHFLSNFNHFNQFTLETYIYESGFKNRSTFYVAFKKYVGVNPSFYLKEKKQLI